MGQALSINTREQLLNNLLGLFLSMSLFRSHLLFCSNFFLFLYFVFFNYCLAIPESQAEASKGSKVELRVGDIDGDKIDELFFFQKPEAQKLGAQLFVAKKNLKSNSYSIVPNWTLKLGPGSDSFFIAESTGDNLKDILLWKKSQNALSIIDAKKLTSFDSKLQKPQDLESSAEHLALFSFPESILFFHEDSFAIIHRSPGIFWQSGTVEDLRIMKKTNTPKFKTLLFGRKEYPPLAITWSHKLHLGYYVSKKGLIGMKAGDNSSPKLVLDISRRAKVHTADLDSDGFDEIVAWNESSNCFEISYFGNRFEGIMTPTRSQEVCLLKNGKPMLLNKHLKMLHLKEKDKVVLAGFNSTTDSLEIFLKSSKKGLECLGEKPLPVLKKGVSPLSCNILSTFSPNLETSLSVKN